MKVCVLASGSKGNSTFVENENVKLLVDAGMNCKYITERLAEIGVNIKDINYVIISHIHDDHISALKTLINKTKATLLITRPMYNELDLLKNYNNIEFYEDDLYLGNLKITALKSSHDSVDSRNFIIDNGISSVVYITDTGYVKAKYFPKLKNRDVYLMESNHDIEMLNHGPYPAWLKKRVLGDYGHLSNNASSFYLTKLIGNKTKEVVLMHLSETNNTKDKSLETLNNTFKEYDIKFNKVIVSSQNEKTEVINL